VTIRENRQGGRAALLLSIATAFALGLAACGGGDGGDKESEEEGGTVACEGTPVTPKLPADFPQVSGVTYTKSTTSGPSEVADGYYEGELEKAYESYKSGFEDAGYTVTFDEIEEHDSEVAYKGGSPERTGIVALRDNCEESDRISVHVTSRPS
jgi:hypothetical protein